MAAKANTAGSGKAAGDGQDVDTDTTENTGQDADVDTDATNNQADDDAGDDSTAKLPKSPEELNKLITDRLARQAKSLIKKFEADKKKLTTDKDKSEVELEKQKVTERTGKIADKNFLLAARDAGANSVQAEKLLKLNRADFDTDDDGEILNIEDLIEASKKDFSEFFKGGSGSGDGGAGGKDKIKDPAQAWNDSIKQELGYK